MVLSIGGMDMKKKKDNIESEDWKKMCGAQSSIPN